MRSYETDYAGWAEDTARAICEGRLQDIDRETVADEVASVSKREQRKLVSRLAHLMLHRLKQRYQPMRASRSWEMTIIEQRQQALDLLEESPSLKSRIEEAYRKAYRQAR